MSSSESWALTSCFQNNFAEDKALGPFPGCEPALDSMDAGGLCQPLCGGLRIKPQFLLISVGILVPASPIRCHCDMLDALHPCVRQPALISIPEGGVEGPKVLHILWGGCEGAVQKELFLWTCSSNQANPPHVVAGRITMACPQVTRGKKRSLLELLTAPALFSHVPFPLQLGAGHKPPAYRAIPPFPAPWPSALTTPALLFCATSSPSISLTPRSLLLTRKHERWGRERFPQLCTEMFECVKRQSLSPLQHTSCCCHKSGQRRRRGRVGAWGALCDPKGKTLRKEQNKYPLLPPSLNKRGQNQTLLLSEGLFPTPVNTAPEPCPGVGL